MEDAPRIMTSEKDSGSLTREQALQQAEADTHSGTHSHLKSHLPTHHSLTHSRMALRASLVQEVLKLAYTHRGQVSGCIDCRSIGARTGAFIGAFDHWLELHTYHDKQRPVPEEARAFLVQAIGIHPHARLLRTRSKLVIAGAAEPPNRVDVREGLEVFNIVRVLLGRRPVDEGDGEVRQQGTGGYVFSP